VCKKGAFAPVSRDGNRCSANRNEDFAKENPGFGSFGMLKAVRRRSQFGRPGFQSERSNAAFRVTGFPDVLCEILWVLCGDTFVCSTTKS